jgi:hypothetical protein
VRRPYTFQHNAADDGGGGGIGGDGDGDGDGGEPVAERAARVSFADVYAASLMYMCRTMTAHALTIQTTPAAKLISEFDNDYDNCDNDYKNGTKDIISEDAFPSLISHQQCVGMFVFFAMPLFIAVDVVLFTASHVAYVLFVAADYLCFEFGSHADMHLSSLIFM